MTATPTIMVSTRRMRKAVAKWLLEEAVTIEQALELESAVYAGLIAGSSYRGRRHEPGEGIGYDVDWEAERKKGIEAEIDYEDVKFPSTCGCLLDTIEQIKGGRRQAGVIEAFSQQTYNLALTLNLGDTPSNSKWARAAVRGIQDYVAYLEQPNG